MRVLGAIIAAVGFLISLTGLGFLIGVPLIILGLTGLIAPKFMWIALAAGVISYELKINSLEMYLMTFIFLMVILIAIQAIVESYISRGKIDKNSTSLDSNFHKKIQNFKDDGIILRDKSESYTSIDKLINDESNSEEPDEVNFLIAEHLEILHKNRQPATAIKLLTLCGLKIKRGKKSYLNVERLNNHVIEVREEDLVEFAINEAINYNDQNKNHQSSPNLNKTSILELAICDGDVLAPKLDGVTLYEHPNSKSQIIGKLKKSDQVIYLEQDDANFIKILTPDVEGWADKRLFLKI